MTDSAALSDTVLASSDVSSEPPLAVGTTVDHYRIEARLGMGGMGVVYRAHDMSLGRDVALKLVRDPTPGTETCAVLCTLLANEARTMARLAHPNLVSVFGTGLHAGRVYVALELVEGETLREWCVREQPHWRERIRVLLEVAAGLVAAHGAGVFHRDVKPENVLVGRDGRVRLTDFGIARSAFDITAEGAAIGCGRALSAEDLAAATAFSGTLAYMSPQQLRGEAADARCDQFSYAVTCWEMLLGALPFRGHSPAERLGAILREGLEHPTAHDVPGAILIVLSRALRPGAEDRDPSMGALVEAFTAAAQQ